MSDRVVEIAVEKSPYFMPDLSKAGYQITKNMLIRGLSSNGSILRTYYSEGFPVDLDIEMVAVENGYTDVDALYNRYKEKNQKIPTKLIDAMTKSSKVGFLFSRMISHNKDNPNDIIPFTEQQLVRAMIADIQGRDHELYKDVLDLREEQPMVSENGWLEFIKGANPSRSVIRRLIKYGVLSDKAIRQLLPKYGFLLEFLSDATYDEQVAAIKNDPGLVKLIPESSPKLQELQILAVTLDPNAISVIDNPSFDIFKIAASHKEPNWNEQDGLGTLYVYDFLTSLKYGANRGLLTEENKNQILTMLIKSEPRRIISLINYDDEDFPVTEELQLLAVDKSPRMVDTLLNHNIIPSTQVLIKHIEAGGRLSTVLDKLRIINRYSSTGNTEIDDAVYLAYLDKNQHDPREAWRLLSDALNNNLNPGNAVVDAILKIHPKSIVTALAHKLDISDDQILDAIRRGGVDRRNAYTFLSAIEQRYGNLPEQILLAYMESNTSSDPRNVITNLLDITSWAEENDQEIPLSVYKYAIKKDYASMRILKLKNLPQELMQELKDYNYKVNGYWQPLDVGDLVRLTNPKATPKFEITGIRYDSYRIDVDGKTESFPKDRIHRANSIAEPADYEQKRKLFVKKYPIDAAYAYLESNAVRQARGMNSQILNSQFQDTLKKYEITDIDDIDRLKSMLESSMIQLVDQYLPAIR
jgi:hypothetical protein